MLKILFRNVFIKAFQKIHQIKEEVSLGAWLKRIVVNASLDSIRKKKNEYWIEETRVLETETEEMEMEDAAGPIAKKLKRQEQPLQ